MVLVLPRILQYSEWINAGYFFCAFRQIKKAAKKQPTWYRERFNANIPEPHDFQKGNLTRFVQHHLIKPLRINITCFAMFIPRCGFIININLLTIDPDGDPISFNGPSRRCGIDMAVGDLFLLTGGEGYACVDKTPQIVAGNSVPGFLCAAWANCVES